MKIGDFEIDYWELALIVGAAVGIITALGKTGERIIRAWRGARREEEKDE